MPGTRHLFTVTRGLLRIATLLCLAAIVVLSLALGALILAALGVFQLPMPANEMHGLTMSEILGAGSMALAAGVTCIALVAWMFLLMARIVDTASHGDPFVAQNADRLNQIGLLLLALQAIGLAAEIAMNLFPEKIKDHISFGFDV